MVTCRLATRDDIPALVPLMKAAINELQRDVLTAEQIAAGPHGQVDRRRLRELSNSIARRRAELRRRGTGDFRHSPPSEPSMSGGGARDTPRAWIVLISGGERRAVAPVERDTPCDLALVHRLLWLRVRAKRMGWSLRLVDVDDELRELLELVGVASSLVR